ncbi:MAG: 3-oxoacyl-[acyl-carrier-protein] reductase [Candidatus Omnitrophota bacterium]|jgi:3-oxoacyl-[acyl-carrier protein] reductase
MLKNKIGIITGGSRGIGRAIVKELAAAGAKVAFTYAKSDVEAKTLLKEIADSGSEALSFKGDVRDYNSCREFVEQVKSYFGGLDFLVNNAGITRDKAFMTMEKEEWQVVIDVNLTGYFNMARSCIVTFLKQKNGNIVNISSISGISGIARQVNYSAAKAGIIGLTKSLAREVAPYNIRVNCVAPGFIETDMIAVLKEDLKEKYRHSVPLGRFGDSKDVAKTVSFLLSDQSNYITGQVIKVDGGLSMSN